jgi:hypothetical protein
MPSTEVEGKTVSEDEIQELQNAKNLQVQVCHYLNLAQALASI